MYGIDTMQISTELKYHQWIRVQAALLRGGGGKWQYQYNKEGVHRISFPCCDEHHYFGLRLQVSPAMLLGRTPCSITPVDIVRDELPAALQSWLVRHTGLNRWPDALDWSLDRVDFACDVTGLEPGELDAYIALARAGQCPKSFEVQHLPGWIGTARYGNKNEAIQFYDKGRQMQKRNRFSQEVIDSYRGTLRVEVQIEKARLERIRRQANWPARTLRYFAQDGLAEAIIRQRAGEVLGHGPYITIGRAKQRLAAHKTNQKLSEAEHKKLCGAIDYIAGCGAMHAAKAKCVSGDGPFTAATLARYQTALSELDIFLPLLPARGAIAMLPPLLSAAGEGVSVTLAEWLKNHSRKAVFEQVRSTRRVVSANAASLSARQISAGLDELAAVIESMPVIGDLDEPEVMQCIPKKTSRKETEIMAIKLQRPIGLLTQGRLEAPLFFRLRRPLRCLEVFRQTSASISARRILRGPPKGLRRSRIA